ncbi:MAG: GTPase domain-containing protein, partial [Sedimenticola sp.]
MNPQHPVFAVVGHPNKGKSSVVAALTQNDQVEISPLSGTTRVAQHFTLKLDQRVVFELVDTPGFQRARGCLSWLKKEEVPADRKPQRVKQFVDAFTLSDR